MVMHFCVCWNFYCARGFESQSVCCLIYQVKSNRGMNIYVLNHSLDQTPSIYAISNRSSYFFYTFRMHRLQNYNCNFPPFLLYCNCNFSHFLYCSFVSEEGEFPPHESDKVSQPRCHRQSALVHLHRQSGDCIPWPDAGLDPNSIFFLVNCIFELTRRPSRAFNLASSCVASGKSEIRARYLVALVQGLRRKQVIQTLIVCL